MKQFSSIKYLTQNQKKKKTRLNKFRSNPQGFICNFKPIKPQLYNIFFI